MSIGFNLLVNVNLSFEVTAIICQSQNSFQHILLLLLLVATLCFHYYYEFNLVCLLLGKPIVRLGNRLTARKVKPVQASDMHR